METSRGDELGMSDEGCCDRSLVGVAPVTCTPGTWSGGAISPRSGWMNCCWCGGCCPCCMYWNGAYIGAVVMSGSDPGPWPCDEPDDEDDWCWWCWCGCLAGLGGTCWYGWLCIPQRVALTCGWAEWVGQRRKGASRRGFVKSAEGPCSRSPLCVVGGGGGRCV